MIFFGLNSSWRPLNVWKSKAAGWCAIRRDPWRARSAVDVEQDLAVTVTALRVEEGEGLLDRLRWKSHFTKDPQADGPVRAARTVPHEATLLLVEVTSFRSAEPRAELPPAWVPRSY